MIRMTLVALLWSAVAFAAGDPNRFEDATAGIALTKPASWHFVSRRAAIQNRDKVKMQTEEMQKAVQSATAPLVVLAKHTSPYNGLNPTLQIIVRPTPEVVADMTPVQILRKVMPMLQKGFADFVLESDVRAVRIGDRDAADFVARYTVTTQGGPAFPARARMIAIPRKGYLILIGMSSPPEGTDDARGEFETILGSLSISD